MKPRRWKFALGTKVRVQGVRGTACVILRCPTIAPGAVIVEPRLDGIRYWNEDTLIRVKVKKP